MPVAPQKNVESIWKQRTLFIASLHNDIFLVGTRFCVSAVSDSTLSPPRIQEGATARSICVGMPNGAHRRTSRLFLPGLWSFTLITRRRSR